jgi:hypothetical protein
MKFTERARTVWTLAGFAVAFVALTVNSYVRESATWDEPQHLTTGYVMWTRGDYRIDPEHPPLLRMWAALPLLLTRDIKLDTRPIDASDQNDWVGSGQFFFCHDFLYRQNDADRLLDRARFMIVLLGILLGVLIFCWARDMFGYWPAALALALYMLEPNLLAHSRLVTTDLGLTCFTVGTLYFLWRTTRQCTAFNLTGLTLFFALANVSKFSAILLWPVVAVLLAGWGFRSRRWGTALGAAGFLFVTSWLAVWAVYGFRYAPSANPQWLYRFDADPSLQARLPALTSLAGWVDRHRLLPNACTQGFLLGQAKAQARSCFLAGHYSTAGWWYYFPAALLLKTPVTLLLLALAGLVLCATRPQLSGEHAVYLVFPATFYLIMAMTARLNIGVRHILVLYPLAILLAAKAGREFPRNWSAILWVPLAGLSLFEFDRATPHYLAFFNQCIGGPRHGYKYLADSNLDWGQDLKGLKRWMDANHVEHINLAYFGTADPAYYHIQCTYLPGGPFFAENLVRAPQLPGYVAVSTTTLTGVYLNELGRAFYRPLLDREPVARIGYSIHVYWVDRPWWR